VTMSGGLLRLSDGVAHAVKTIAINKVNCSFISSPLINVCSTAKLSREEPHCGDELAGRPVRRVGAQARRYCLHSPNVLQ
jgi:hypothetical protein